MVPLGTSLLLALAVGAAAAQTDDADSSTRSGPSLLEQQNLTGDWRGVRPALSAHGLKPYLVYTGTLWGNVNGGQATGVQLNGYLDCGVDLDLHKLGLWQGL